MKYTITSFIVICDTCICKHICSDIYANRKKEFGIEGCELTLSNARKLLVYTLQRAKYNDKIKILW